MHSVQGRGAAGRRYFQTRPYQDGEKRIYRVWQPPGEDGEGDRAQGCFFVGKSGHWYECVDKTIEQLPNSIQFAYERTEAAMAREASDPVSQATIAHANREIMRVKEALRTADIRRGTEYITGLNWKEPKQMNNDLLDGPTDLNPTGDTLLTAVAAIVRALATVRPECRQQVMTAAQVLMPQPVQKLSERAHVANFYEQNHQAQQELAKHVAAQTRAFGVGVPSPQQEQRLREEAQLMNRDGLQQLRPSPYVDLDPRGEPREPGK